MHALLMYWLSCLRVGVYLTVVSLARYTHRVIFSLRQVVPTSKWNIPTFKVIGRPILPQRSLYCGPAYIAGDCTSAGLSARWPWLLLLVLIGFGANLWSAILVYRDYSKHLMIDYVWVSVMLIANLAPLVSTTKLWDTRQTCSSSLRPLLASKAVQPGVKVEVIGNPQDEVVQCLSQFLEIIGHDYSKYDKSMDRTQHLFKINAHKALGSQQSIDSGSSSLALDVAAAAHGESPLIAESSSLSSFSTTTPKPTLRREHSRQSSGALSSPPPLQNQISSTGRTLAKNFRQEKEAEDDTINAGRLGKLVVCG